MKPKGCELVKQIPHDMNFPEILQRLIFAYGCDHDFGLGREVKGFAKFRGGMVRDEAPVATIPPQDGCQRDRDNIFRQSTATAAPMLKLREIGW